MAGRKITLGSQDLIRFEHALKDEIAAFIPFTSYSLYFPQEMPFEMRDPDAEPGGIGALAIHLPSERKLLLPLVQEGRFLGVFQARGVVLKAPKAMLPFLAHMASLCLDKLAMYKRSVSDALTGLEAREPFTEALERELDVVRNCVRPGAGGCADFSLPVYRAGLGVICIQVDDLERIQQQYGFLLADRLLTGIGDTVDRLRPKQVHAAHWNEGRFFLFMPEAMSNACRKLAEDLAHELSQLRHTHELTGERVRVGVSVGLANYPQDMEGALFERALAEQARQLLRKALKAASVAREQGPGAVLAFADILEHGGQVREVLPVNRLLVSLGRDAGAKEGQRFLVWSPGKSGSEERPPLYKGEVALMEVLERTSLAEIMHLGDPAWSIAPGDRLTLLKDALGPSARSDASDQAEQRDTLTGLLLYRDFLLHWTRARESCQEFVLALLRLGVEDGDLEHARAEQQAVEVAILAREHFGQELVGGRYSLNSLLLFHPGMGAEQAQASYTDLVRRLGRHGIIAAAGLASHPYLHCSKADALENSRKALEYALLLPEPHVGCIDTLALNISADKLFSQGDLYAAMEEYKLALLADEDNTMARNSLGICLARIGQLPQARQHFEEVLRRDKKDVMALYNLGFTRQRMGEAKEAREAYKKCLKHDPNNVFALIRLGQLSERDNRLSQARGYYDKAASLEAGRGVTQRYLARLALRQGKVEEARERLHQALLHDPKDAFSMHLLAKLYLDNGEDPSIAASLARESVALRPDTKVFWLELARAFEAQGKQREAQEAMARAGQR
jgi:GGDEF domain-containing protein/Tfp pilus assembly protein PilF